MQLREYQLKQINEVRSQIRSGARRILLQLPTGGGKTAEASYIISQTIAKGNRAMMTVHRSELAEQTAKTMKLFGVPFGMIQAGEPANLKQPMQIASILTLRNRINKIPIPAVLIIDEAQHSVSRTWREVIDHYTKQGTVIIGLSATPKRLSGESLRDCYDVMVQGPTIRELIDAGYLSTYKYFAPEVGIDTQTIKIKCGDFDKSELEIAVNKNKITGDVIEHYKRLVPGKRVIIFCVTVAHAKAVTQQFSAAGVPAEMVEGSMPKEARKSALQRFRAGDIKALANVEIAGEGVDIPAVEAVILLRPTMSEALYLQQVGRALRTDPENPDKVAVILDHCGNVYRHNLPDAPREWTLDGIKRRKSQAGGVGVRTCTQCYMCHSPAPVCPYCGFEYQMTSRMLAEEAGELKEFDAAEAAKTALRKRITLNECKTIADLQEFARDNNYNPGWVRIRARLKNIRS